MTGITITKSPVNKILYKIMTRRLCKRAKKIHRQSIIGYTMVCLRLIHNVRKGCDMITADLGKFDNAVYNTIIYKLKQDGCMIDELGNQMIEIRI